MILQGDDVWIALIIALSHNSIQTADEYCGAVVPPCASLIVERVGGEKASQRERLSTQAGKMRYMG
jgi:hypothetical protein